MKTEYTAKSGDKFEIEYNEGTNTWQAEFEDEAISHESLSGLKERLDRKTSPKAKARKVPVLASEGYGLVKGVATSVTDAGQTIRVTTSTGERVRVNKGRVYSANTDNQKLADEIEELFKQKREIEKQLADMRRKLAPLDIDLLMD
jgi:hypothetical protein